MKRNEKELITSAGIGGAVTLIMLSQLHEGLTAGELITFWVSVHMLTTAGAWWMYEKCRAAWQSIHGRGVER